MVVTVSEMVMTVSEMVMTVLGMVMTVLGIVMTMSGMVIPIFLIGFFEIFCGKAKALSGLLSICIKLGKTM